MQKNIFSKDLWTVTKWSFSRPSSIVMLCAGVAVMLAFNALATVAIRESGEDVEQFLKTL